MSDRHCALTVTIVFDTDVHHEDSEQIMEAIKQIRHVAEVIPVVASPEYYSAKFHASWGWKKKLYQFLKDN